MAEKVLETMPLRDRVREAERLVRELSDHLERGFLPKVHEARKATRTTSNALEEIMDSTVRSTVDTALTSHEYTVQLLRTLDDYLTSIDRELEQMVTGGEASSSRKQS